MAKFYPPDDVMLNGSANVASATPASAAPASSVTENIHQNQIDQLISCRPETVADTPGGSFIHVFQAL